MDIALRTRFVHHVYHHTTTTGGHGHLSGGAVVAILVIALIALAIWGFVKYSQSN